MEARLIQGELEEACRLGNAALEAVGKTGSHRVRRKLMGVYKRTAEFTGVGVVAELRDNMRPMVNAGV